MLMRGLTFAQVDPTRIDKNDDVKSNWKKLISYATTLWERIEASQSRVPR